MHTCFRITFAAAAAAALLLGASAAQAQVAYISSEKDNALTVLDLKTEAVTGTVPTCKRPRHMQKSPDGKQLLVACGESNAADVIDLASRKSVGRIPLGDDPEAFDISRVSHNPAGFDTEKLEWMNGTALAAILVQLIGRWNDKAKTRNSPRRRATD